MSVTNQKSTEISNAEATPPALNAPSKKGRLEAHVFSFTQNGAGDAGSTVEIVKLPPGRYSIVGGLSKIAFSAFGASRVLDLGWSAHTDGGGSSVSASPNGIDDNIDVSAAGAAEPGSALTGTLKEIDARDGVTIYATVSGGTIPDAATLDGYLTVIRG